MAGNHFTYGLVTPVLAFLVAVLGALLGLTCVLRARDSGPRRQRRWFLALATWAFGGTGIWVTHFITTLGYSMDETAIRYDVPLTLASAAVVIATTGVSLFMLDVSRPRPARMLLGGLLISAGIAGMHYLGMAAMQMPGTVRFDSALVALSLACAVVASALGLWCAVTVRRPGAIVGAAVVIGLAITGMHYGGMFAMRMETTGGGHTAPATGVSGVVLLLPIMLMVALAVIGLAYALMATPAAGEHGAPEEETTTGDAGRRQPEGTAVLAGQSGSASDTPRSVSAPPAAPGGSPDPAGQRPQSGGAGLTRPTSLPSRIPRTDEIRRR